MDQTREKPKVIVVCGPTGTGKTATAIRLAARFNSQIISADSMQVYRYMDIGTAKPSLSEQQKVDHHLIDIVDPDEPFNAASFAKMAKPLICELREQGIAPFIVGGTGMYIKALLKGLFQVKPIDPAVRKRLKKEAADRGSVFLHQRLCGCDPDTAKKIHPNDTYRVLRALEVFETTGKPISQLQYDHAFGDMPFSVLKIGLEISREQLYDRIDQRVDDMLSAGLLGEVTHLLTRGYAPTLKSMQSIGYRHIVAFIEGRLSWEEMTRTFKRDTRRYAKRQLTWFKADTEINWIEIGKENDMLELIRTFLTERG